MTAGGDDALPGSAAEGDATLTLPPPKYLRWEIFVVFAVSLGASGLNALLSLIGSLLQKQSLSSQQALLVGSLSPIQWYDLVLQLVGIAEALTPVVLVLYLMARSGEPPSVMGLDTSQPGRDLVRGAALAAVIGGAGLGLYVAAFNLGISLNIVPESLPNVWWRIPVLLLSAAHDGILEEILVIGYLLRRLDQLGWTPWKAIVAARSPARLLPPLPGLRRVHRQRCHGRHLRHPVPPVGPGDADDHRPRAHRRGDVRRLRSSRAQGVLAAVTRTGLRRLPAEARQHHSAGQTGECRAWQRQL